MQINFSNAAQEIKSLINQSDPKAAAGQEPARAEKTSVSSQEPVRTQTENIAELKSLLAEHDINLEFSRDDTTKELVIKLVDEKTGESIRQFPSEVSLRLAATYAKIQGQFLDQKF